MHGVNLDQLGRRDPLLYGTLTLAELERRIEADARALGLATRFFQTNHEGAFVEHLHSLRGATEADAILLNPGAWTHYAWAIRDALEIAGAAGARDPPLRRRAPRAVAARVGDRRAVLRDHLRARPRRLPRRARAAARGARRDGRARERPRGRGAAARTARARRGWRGELGELELDALLVDSLVDVRYLTGFTGSNGLALVVGGRRARSSARTASSPTSATRRSRPSRCPGLPARDRRRRAARGARRRARRAGGAAGLRRGEPHGRRTARLAELLGEAGSWSPARRGAAAARRQGRRRGRPHPRGQRARRRGAAQRVLEDGVVGSHRARGRDRAGAAHAPPGRQAPSFRRSSPRAPTARCRTPSRASRRSRATCC